MHSINSIISYNFLQIVFFEDRNLLLLLRFRLKIEILYCPSPINSNGSPNVRHYFLNIKYNTLIRTITLAECYNL